MDENILTAKNDPIYGIHISSLYDFGMWKDTASGVCDDHIVQQLLLA